MRGIEHIVGLTAGEHFPRGHKHVVQPLVGMPLVVPHNIDAVVRQLQSAIKEVRGEDSLLPLAHNAFCVLSVIEVKPQPRLLFWGGGFPTAQPGHTLNVWHSQGAEGEGDEQDDDEVGDAAVNIVPEQGAGMDVTEDKRIVHDEVDHAVLAYIIYQRYAWRGQREQNTREACQREHDDEHGLPEGPCPCVGMHLVLAMQEVIGQDKPYAEQDADDKGMGLRETVQPLVPHFPQVEEEHAAEDIAQVEPKRVAVQEEPVADKGEEEDHPMQMAYLLDEMHQDIGGEERQQEPERPVAEGQTAHPPAELAHHCQRIVQASRQDAEPAESQDSPDDAPGDVWHQQTADAVVQVG